jgi:hypothetical protein
MSLPHQYILDLLDADIGNARSSGAYGSFGTIRRWFEMHGLRLHTQPIDFMMPKSIRDQNSNPGLFETAPSYHRAGLRD